MTAAKRLREAFGSPVRETKKVKAWEARKGLEVVLEVGSPTDNGIANLWVPFPADNQPVPEFALQYPGETGRHSNTFPSRGLERGLPALKLILRSASDVEGAIAYITAMRDSLPLPEVKSDEPGAVRLAASPSGETTGGDALRVDVESMPKVMAPKARREAIPRMVQREVWQRDGGQCVECSTRERLCFDHIVPFSRGGSNTVRNVQLLCEPCNLSKSNRL